MDLFTLPYNPLLVDYLHDPDNFMFSMTLEKSETGKEGKWNIQGVASAEIKDQDGEILIQKGMDCEPLLRGGFINWDHHDDRGPAYLIGEPTDVEIVPASRFADRFGKSFPGAAMFVRGFLYNDPENKPIAAAVWKHLNTADVSPARQIRWSVQGRTFQRAPTDQRYIVKSECRHLALTHQPILGYTFTEIAKSLAALSTQSAEPLLKENLPGQHMTDLLYGECKNRCYGHDGKFMKGALGAFRHLTGCRGRDIRKSQALVMALHDNGHSF